MAYEEKQVSLLAPGANAGQKVVAEIPLLLIEIDPEGAPRKRRFVVAGEDQVVEAENLVYVGTVSSQAAKGALFHMFEEVAPKPE